MHTITQRKLKRCKHQYLLTATHLWVEDYMKVLYSTDYNATREQLCIDERFKRLSDLGYL